VTVLLRVGESEEGGFKDVLKDEHLVVKGRETEGKAR